MGRGVIVSEQGAGLYRVQLDFDRTRADALIADLQAKAATAAAGLPALQTAYQDAISMLASANADFQTAILTGDVNVIAAAEHRMRPYQLEAAVAQERLAEATLHHAALLRQIQTLQTQVPTDPTVDAWCADYTLGLTAGTEVGTIEVGYASQGWTLQGQETGYLVQPGRATGASAYSAARDGVLVPIMSQLPEQAFLNWCLLPGVAKWRPRYRVGTVTAVAVANNTVDVDLDALAVGLPALDGNQTASLAAVAVEYMGEGAVWFAVDDRVVVEFRPDPADTTWWGVPYVIGFAAEPVANVDVPAVYLYDGFAWKPPGTGPWTVEFHLVHEVSTPWGYATGTDGWWVYGTGPFDSLTAPFNAAHKKQLNVYAWASVGPFYGAGQTLEHALLGVAAVQNDAAQLPAFLSTDVLTVSWPQVPRAGADFSTYYAPGHGIPISVDPNPSPEYCLLRTTSSDLVQKTYPVRCRPALDIRATSGGSTGTTLTPPSVPDYYEVGDPYDGDLEWFGYTPHAAALYRAFQAIGNGLSPPYFEAFFYSYDLEWR